MQPTTVLEEYGRKVVAGLTDAQARELNLSRALTVTPVAAAEWELKAAQYVGVVHAEGVEVRIQPKVETKRLLFMLAYSLRQEGWRDLVTTLGTDEEPVDAIAHAFVYHSEAALTQGILQGYVTVEEALPGLRGRLREGDQLRRRFGMLVPLEVRFDDFTADITENRMLVSAARRLLASRSVAGGTRRRLRRLGRKLAEVTPFSAGERIPSVRIDRRNQRYENALALARLVLESMTIEMDGARHSATSFLFDMNRVFEDFVTKALQAGSQPGAGRFVPQRVSYLDIDDTIKLKPDLSWVDGGSTRAVADLKYKSLAVKDMPNADAYQMLAYCTALGLRSGHLVYAAGNEEEGVKRVRNRDVGIVTWTVNLDREPHELLDSIDDLGRSIRNWDRPGLPKVTEGRRPRSLDPASRRSLPMR
jgi:5-methylcytosine-specific restriction enzyme subunit McrC